MIEQTDLPFEDGIALAARYGNSYVELTARLYCQHILNQYPGKYPMRSVLATLDVKIPTRACKCVFDIEDENGRYCACCDIFEGPSCDGTFNGHDLAPVQCDLYE